jgi:exosome complex component RRP42
MSDQEIISRIKKDHIKALAAKGKRIDGRSFDEPREIEVTKNPISIAEGSARCKLGKTDIFVGVKVEVGTPYPDSPDRGVMTTNAELIPMASPTFESGPPRPPAVELARVVDRGIRESGCIDFSSLCIEPGEKVWIVFIDIHIVDYDGNLFDAAGIAAMAALNNTIIPKSKFELGEDEKLPITVQPLLVTHAKFGDYIMVDPGLDEDLIADARLSVGIDENGHVRAMQKGRSGAFTKDEVMAMVKRAREVSEIYRKHVV